MSKAARQRRREAERHRDRRGQLAIETLAKLGMAI
jgi:hypothetical protein